MWVHYIDYSIVKMAYFIQFMCSNRSDNDILRQKLHQNYQNCSFQKVSFNLQWIFYTNNINSNDNNSGDNKKISQTVNINNGIIIVRKSSEYNYWHTFWMLEKKIVQVRARINTDGMICEIIGHKSII